MIRLWSFVSSVLRLPVRINQKQLICLENKNYKLVEVLLYLAIGTAIVCLIIIGPYLYFTWKIFLKKLNHKTGLQKTEATKISPPATSVEEFQEAEEMR